VSTGVGRFAGYRLNDQAQAEHQYWLQAGRSVGGPLWLPAADVRAAIAIKLRALLALETGASAALCQYLADRLNDRLIAAVPRGGIGCSREIIPLCHAFQTLVGLGSVLEDGVLIAAADALARRGVAPYRAGPKEGIARGDQRAANASAAQSPVHRFAATTCRHTGPAGGAGRGAQVGSRGVARDASGSPLQPHSARSTPPPIRKTCRHSPAPPASNYGALSTACSSSPPAS
jgi:histidine ammonia-lyase